MTTFSLPDTTTTSDPDRGFWRAALLAGGSTTIPRWTLTPVAGVGITRLVGRSNAELAAELSGDRGYTELGELDAQRAEHLGASYRHDCVSAHL